MGTGKLFLYFFLPDCQLSLLLEFFFIFHDVSPLGNADESVQATMAFGLAVSQELNLSFS